MPRYRYIGSEPRNFPTLGLYDIQPGDEFDSDHVVASSVVVFADGRPTDVDDHGQPVTDPATNVDPDPFAGLANASPKAETDAPSDGVEPGEAAKPKAARRGAKPKTPAGDTPPEPTDEHAAAPEADDKE